MPLSKEQIGYIRDFIYKRGFTTIEVEMEALDHLASKVETILEKKPDLNFQLALTKAHSSFGIFGLATLEDSITGSIKMQYRKQFLDFLKSYFTSFNLLYLPLLVLLGYIVLHILPLGKFGTGLQTFFLFYAALWSIPVSIYYLKRARRWGKRSLIIHMSGYGLYITQFVCGYGFGIFTKMLFMEGVALYKPLFIVGFTLTSLSGLIAVRLMRWGIEWANQKFLKYA